MAEQNKPGLMTRLKALMDRDTSALKRVHVIINPASGSDEPILAPLNTVFRDLHIDWQIFVTKRPHDAERYAQQAVAMGVDVVAVYGGDGTVLEAASGMRGSTIPLAILPGGTANVLSIELGIPRDLKEAAALIGAPNPTLRPVDMGLVGDHMFFHLGLGLEGEMIEATDREAKSSSGMMAYIVSTLKRLRNPPLARYRITMDGQTVELDGVNCMVTNFGSVGLGQIKLSHAIDMSDGLLDVLVIKDTNLSTLLTAASDAIFSGDLSNSDSLKHWQAKEVVIEADPPQAATRDGEILDLEEIRATVVPGAVQVLIPSGA
ncbi:MAG TPA: diacylglycerol kinase family protein [Aggregatilineaceae bacterium]|nr:diacylglycerol kinase family protein [Aggregatilineaceae bacterium]